MITDIATLLTRAEELDLKLTTDKTDFDRSGLDFLVLDATDEHNTTWMVRTPKHPKAYEATIHESKMLEFLRPRLSVAIPDWRLHETDIIAYPRLPGTPAWTYHPQTGLVWNGLDVSNPQTNFLKSTAGFLAQLHSMNSTDLQNAGARCRSIDQVRETIREACVTTRPLLNPTERLWQRWQDWLEDDSYWPKENALTHGDFHPGHMLLDSSLSLIGVLDWTEAELADPSVDFGIFFGCFGKEHLLNFLGLYCEAGGKVYDRLADHVMERWAAYAPLVAQWGLKNDQQAVVEHAKQHLVTTETQMLALTSS
ncbi:MAG: macrolide 2'-phosphotransferase [Oligoflexus sp.]